MIMTITPRKNPVAIRPNVLRVVVFMEVVRQLVRTSAPIFYGEIGVTFCFGVFGT